GAGGDPSTRVRASAVLRDVDLSPRRAADRAGPLFLHVLDLPRPANPLSGGSIRAARGARPRRRPRAAESAGAHRGAPRLRADGVGGAGLEYPVDPVLPPTRRGAAQGVDSHATHGRAAAAARTRPVVTRLRVPGPRPQ